MSSIIFYGAGRNAAEKLKLWEEQGLVLRAEALCR